MFGNELLNFIADHAGADIAAKVQDAFGGEAFYIPKRKPIDEKQEFIQKHFGQMDTRQLARATGLTVRAIQIRLNRPISKQQGTLF